MLTVGFYHNFFNSFNPSVVHKARQLPFITLKGEPESFATKEILIFRTIKDGGLSFNLTVCVIFYSISLFFARVSLISFFKSPTTLYLIIGITESRASMPGRAVYAKNIIFFVPSSNVPLASPS